jgi:hypothetical protein
VTNRTRIVSTAVIALAATMWSCAVNQAAEAAPASRQTTTAPQKVVAGAPAETTKPGPAEPATTKPGTTKPASTKPGTAKPATAKPGKTKTVTETRPIRFATRTVKDGMLAKGVTKTRTKGVPGLRTLTYKITLTADHETTRKLVKSVVTRKPVTKVIAVGTMSIRRCDPNYGGACVPIASDVDCAGGKGNGPAYVRGPVRVTGRDVYDLDRDGDGIGCNS